MATLTAQSFPLAIGQAKTVTVTMDAPPAGGVASWSMRFRLRLPDGTAIDKTTGAGVACTDPAAGAWDISLTRADTIGLQERSYAWSFWDTLVGEESPVAYGTAQAFQTAETG